MDSAQNCPQLRHFSHFRLSVSLSIFDVKMADIHKVYLSSLFLAYLFQFQNPALLSSPLLSLLIGSVLARYFQVELAAPSRQSSHGCWSLNFDNCIIIQFIKKETFFCNFSNIRFFSFLSLLCFVLFFLFAAKDEDGTSCSQSSEALPTFPPGLHHRDHLQLSGQGRITLSHWLPPLIHVSFWSCWLINTVSHLQKLIPVSESDFILKFLEVKFGLNTTTWVSAINWPPCIILCGDEQYPY